MLLNVSVNVTKDNYKKFFNDLFKTGYNVCLKDNTSSMWVDDVCVGEQYSSDEGEKFVLYPAAFARFKETEK